MTEPVSPPALPRLPLRSLEDLLACAAYIHEDRCPWMGGSAEHPCRCGVPRTIRAVAAVWAEDPPASE